MRTEHLEYFVAISRAGSFSKAAKMLFVSEPALNKSFTAFEKELGFKLLVRSTRGLSLTPAGKEFLPKAERILAFIAESVESARNVNTREESTLGIAHLALDSDPTLLRIARQFAERYGAGIVQLSEGPSGKYIDRVDAEEIDLGISVIMDTASIPSSMEFRVIRELSTNIIVSEEDPLARCDAVEVDDLVSQTLIFTSNAPHEGDMYLADAVARKGKGSKFLTVNSISSALPLLRIRNGVMVKSSLYTPPDGFVAVRVSLDKTPLLVMFWKRVNSSPLLAEFIDLYLEGTAISAGEAE